MNIKKLSQVQRKLDHRIVEGKGLQGVDLLDEKILALQVELGELANEWRGFKFWSEDKTPNRTGYIECEVCMDDQPGQYEVFYGDKLLSYPCQMCDGHEEVYVGDRMLEEYADCLSFILSIGNDLKLTPNLTISLIIMKQETITDAFLDLFELISGIDDEFFHKEEYSLLFVRFIELGELLGFTWEQIEQAYYDKNKINHKRQDEGY